CREDHCGTAARGELMNPPPPPRAGPQAYLNLAIAGGIGVVNALPGRDESTLRVGRNDRVNPFKVGGGQRLDRRPARARGGRHGQRGPGGNGHDRRRPDDACESRSAGEPTAHELPAPKPHAGKASHRSPLSRLSSPPAAEHVATTSDAKFHKWPIRKNL